MKDITTTDSNPLKKPIFRTINGEVVRIVPKKSSISMGTIEKKMAPPDASRLIARGVRPSDFNIEQLKGTDSLVVREKGQQHGVITTADDLDRVVIHLEQQRKARLIQQGGQNRRLKL